MLVEQDFLIDFRVIHPPLKQHLVNVGAPTLKNNLAILEIKNRTKAQYVP